MIDSVVNQFSTMSAGEGIYTICFTAFFVVGGLCCCRRCERPDVAPRVAEPMPEAAAEPQLRAPRKRNAHICGRACPDVQQMARVAPRRAVMIPRRRIAALAHVDQHVA